MYCYTLLLQLPYTDQIDLSNGANGALDKVTGTQNGFKDILWTKVRYLRAQLNHHMSAVTLFRKYAFQKN